MHNQWKCTTQAVGEKKRVVKSGEPNFSRLIQTCTLTNNMNSGRSGKSWPHPNKNCIFRGKWVGPIAIFAFLLTSILRLWAQIQIDFSAFCTIEHKIHHKNGRFTTVFFTGNGFWVAYNANPIVIHGQKWDQENKHSWLNVILKKSTLILSTPSEKQLQKSQKKLRKSFSNLPMHPSHSSKPNWEKRVSKTINSLPQKPSQKLEEH